MRIGFDGKRLVKNFTGLGNYSRYVVSLLMKTFPSDQFFIYSPTEPKNNVSANFSAATMRTGPTGFSRLFWRSAGIVKDLERDEISVYHGLSNEIPMGISSSKVTSVVTVHDLIFLRYKSWYPYIDRQIYEFKTRYACRHANRIIAVSEKTKQDLVDLLNVKADRIDVIHQDCDPSFKLRLSPEQRTMLKNKYRLPDRYLLNVGTIELRKNLLLLLKALTLLPEKVRLVVVGKRTPYYRQVLDYIAKMGLNEQVIFLNAVPFADLPGIYQQAELFVYPSRYEGFGIPVVEALHSEVPVIAAKGSCLEEAGGAGSLYTHPDKPEQLAELINLVWNDPAKRTEMIKAGKLHIQSFNEVRAAGKLMQSYQKAINDKYGSK